MWDPSGYGECYKPSVSFKMSGLGPSGVLLNVPYGAMCPTGQGCPTGRVAYRSSGILSNMPYKMSVAYKPRVSYGTSGLQAKWHIAKCAL